MGALLAAVAATRPRITSRLARLPAALDRWAGGAIAAGALWLLLAGCALALAGLAPWLSLPLIRSWGGLALPIDLGWGPRIGALNYGTLALAAAVLVWGRALLAFDWRRRGPAVATAPGEHAVATSAGADWRESRADGEPAHALLAPRLAPRPLRTRTLVVLGISSVSIAALFSYQLICVDLARMAQLAEQERTALLIRAHLGYALPPQHLTMHPFQVEATSLGERLALLVQLASVGPLLCVLAGLLCGYGAFVSQRGWRRVGVRAHGPEHARRYSHLLWVALGAAGLGALVVLGRAPAGLLFERAGRQAIAAGEYQTALDDFERARTLDTALDQTPGFHRERGQALYLLHRTADRDVSLFLAQQYRAAGALALAWQEDDLLRQRFPRDALVLADQELTAEQSLERSLRFAPLPTDPETERQRPEAALEPFQPPLAWAEQLLRLQPDNPYAHYLRGRLLVAMHAYEQAEPDFRALQRLSDDSDLQSAGITYLAFCAAGQGDETAERALLRTAIKLDHGYNNTTAREAASGFH